ncbi:MAG: STAS domain-containing protein [Actinomycetales bacterium]
MSDLSVETTGDVRVIRPGARLNLVAAPRLRELVTKEVASGHRRFVVDLGATEFMDSSGLGALIAALKTARQAGGDLRIAATPEQPRMVLQLTNLDSVLHSYGTVDEAVRGI